MTQDFDKKNETILKEQDDHNEKEQNDNIDFFFENEQINEIDKGAIALERVNRLYVVLGWVSAVMALFTTPFVAIAGIIFGVTLQKQRQGSGNAVIVANIVFALINIIFNIIVLLLTANMIGGY
ncbi:MAG TPA: hypothetical protein PLH43_08020 [Acetivibrio sp.]|uniref:hypothetical protein n=1 Tax=Acetivibrio sp. TaxID=1872092 RepID=UPI002C469875|nr:hypothetical protein [Acetivibrio sp.]HOM02757.1 hypothetical protein [Acetivibrio sp.]